jgi:hypothetical protein
VEFGHRTIHIAAQNAYTGATKFGGDSGAGLFLEVADALSTASEFIFQGGSLYPGNFDQNLGALTVTSNSRIFFGGINSNVFFQDSHLSLWSGVLNVNSFKIGQNTLRFGTDSSALTTDQLSRIVKSGYTTAINDDGYIVFTPISVPEPGAAGLIGLGIALIGVSVLRKRETQRSLP